MDTLPRPASDTTAKCSQFQHRTSFRPVRDSKRKRHKGAIYHLWAPSPESDASTSTTKCLEGSGSERTGAVENKVLRCLNVWSASGLQLNLCWVEVSWVRGVAPSLIRASKTTGTFVPSESHLFQIGFLIWQNWAVCQNMTRLTTVDRVNQQPPDWPGSASQLERASHVSAAWVPQMVAEQWWRQSRGAGNCVQARCSQRCSRSWLSMR